MQVADDCQMMTMSCSSLMASIWRKLGKLSALHVVSCQTLNLLPHAFAAQGCDMHRMDLWPMQVAFTLIC